MPIWARRYPALLNRLLWISIFVRKSIVRAIVALAKGAFVALIMGLIALVAPWNGWFVFEIGPLLLFEHYEDELRFGVLTGIGLWYLAMFGDLGVRIPLGSPSRLEKVTCGHLLIAR